MALSGLAIAGIVLIIIGIIMALIGIIVLVLNGTATNVQWWVWALIVGGILIGIIGGIMLAVALSEPELPPCYKPNPCQVPVPVVQPTCPYAAAPVAITPAPIITRPAPIAPVVSQRIEHVGQETFDPDPVTTVEETPPVAVRRQVRGPYGPNGEDAVVSGVYKSPGQRVYRTTDIPEHPVTSNYSTVPVAVNRGAAVNLY